MAKYIAEIQDASGNTVYPATQWEAITNPPTLPNMGDYYKKAEVDAKFNNLSGDGSWQTSGITLGAGVRWYSDEAVSVGCFKVIDFGGWQLVMIHGAVTNVTTAGQVIINLPKSIAPDMQYRYTSPATGQKHTRFLLDTNGNLVTENMSTGSYGAADWIPFDTLYLRKG